MAMRPRPDSADPATVADGLTLDSQLPTTSLQARLDADIGRYLVIDELGRGGMARVYRAYDPKLQREVALKVIRLDRSATDDRHEARARTFREAQAMAKLAHPNVVPVYDVEQSADALFITMEHVPGVTLRKWMRRRRSVPEVLEVFEQAGRGLEAAHTVGLVHRDFKPSNVMVGPDGRVRVMDFGVAAMGIGDRCALTPSGRITATSSSQHLTHTGALMGTPPYMSPEQHRGLNVDARSDQYSFCATLFETLFGTRAFDNEPLDTLLAAKLAGPPDLPESPRLPKHVRRALTRGLAPAPEDRFPDMTSLLSALGARRARPRWPMTLGIATTVAVAAAAVTHTQARHADLCTGVDTKARAVWHDQRQQELLDGLTRTGLSYARTTARRTRDLLDTWTADWIAARREVCEATNMRGEQSQAIMDARNRCLDRQLDHLDATIAVLSAADQTTVARAFRAVSDLPNASRCADVDALHLGTPPPKSPALAAAIDELRHALARSRALHSAGRFDEAKTIVAHLLPSAQQLDYPPLVAEIEVALGTTELELGEFEAAKRLLESGYERSLGHGVDDLAQLAASKMIVLLGSGMGRDDELDPWFLASRALVQRLGRPPVRSAALRLQTAERAMRAGRYDAAELETRQAMNVVVSVHGPDHIETALVRNNLANVLFALQRPTEAIEQLEAARTIIERTLGPSHPHATRVHNNLGVIHARLGNYQEAEKLQRSALKRRQELLGENHVNVAATHENLAMTLQEQRRYHEAAAHHERAIRIMEQAVGPESPKLAPLLNNAGKLSLIRGNPAAALEAHTRALSVAQRSSPSDSPDVLRSRLAIARALSEQYRDDEAIDTYTDTLRTAQSAESPDKALIAEGQTMFGLLLVQRNTAQEARTLLQAAVQTLDTMVQADDRRLGRALHALGVCHLQLKDHAQATHFLERALAVWGKRPNKTSWYAETQLALAQALHAQNGSTPRVQSLVANGAKALTPASGRRSQLDDLQRWASRALP